MDKVFVESSCSVFSYRAGQASLDRSVGRILHKAEKTPIVQFVTPPFNVCKGKFHEKVSAGRNYTLT